MPAHARILLVPSEPPPYGDTKAQRGWVTCPRPQRQERAQLDAWAQSHTPPEHLLTDMETEAWGSAPGTWDLTMPGNLTGPAAWQIPCVKETGWAPSFSDARMSSSVAPSSPSMSLQVARSQLLDAQRPHLPYPLPACRWASEPLPQCGYRGHRCCERGARGPLRVTTFVSLG
ncbi:uncharacterized protein LOC119864194 isoform X2 [Canis lupus familiaris]|uniref:uncharacterized protein LOC119864194 isoform X2 n=1 Tax=Canis lupus familiaris TaxID=9615 RepID=UPI0018F589FE|nr:uncharacterized protein LOC119864194 isoform X2 [Canis lupus familiaris]XP_038310143.1 uncharacterized protein LOC119864194 isoform X2 [Canis lupus familiaris]XP_038418845.1 uncharacterized protein LOC119864194 isoform X2 [Canis lupus familiaris]